MPSNPSKFPNGIDTAELTVNGAAVVSQAELEVLDAVTAGTVTASKAVVVDSNKDASAFRTVVVTNLDAGASGTAGTVDVFPSTAAKGKLAITCTDQTGDTTVSLVAGAMAAARTITLRDPGAAASILTSTDGTAAATTATAAELTQWCDESSKNEIVTTTNVIAASESGRTYFLNAAGGFTSTLPAPALGLWFKFVVKTAPTTAYVITTNGGDNILYGMMLSRAGTAGVAGAARDTFNFVANQAIIGDWAEFHSDGTNWYYHGMVDIAAGNTVAAT